MVYGNDVLIVGLTGGIGSGKSLVASFFKQLDVPVVNADDVARLVVQPEKPALKAIAQQFGDDFLIDGHLDRAKLRAKIFSDPQAKAWLENLLHPIIREESFAQLAQCKWHYKILEAPLLFENGLDAFCAKTITVDAPVNLQIERAASRDQAQRETIVAIIHSQWSREQRLAKTDYIIDNSGDTESTELQVMRLDKILTLLATTGV